MIFCKLCDEATQEVKVSSGDKKMCKKCYNEIVKYKRLQSKVTSPVERDFMKRMDSRFAENLQLGGYVPSCFLSTPSTRKCVMCDKGFSTTTKTTTCHTCYSKLNMYNSLHKYNPASPTLQDYDIYYKEQKRLGLKVPALFEERRRLIW